MARWCSIAGLVVFEHDGKMATYAAMVVACAAALWWAGFRRGALSRLATLTRQAATQLAAQRVAAHLADPHVDQLADQPRRRGEVDDAVALGAAHQLAASLRDGAFDQDALRPCRARAG